MNKWRRIGREGARNKRGNGFMSSERIMGPEWVPDDWEHWLCYPRSWAPGGILLSKQRGVRLQVLETSSLSKRMGRKQIDWGSKETDNPDLILAWRRIKALLIKPKPSPMSLWKRNEGRFRQKDQAFETIHWKHSEGQLIGRISNV